MLRHVTGRFDDELVRAIDYGIRGMHLAYDLLDGWDALILVDAVPGRGAPGTLRIFEADHETLTATAGFDAHSMDPGAVFAGLRALGGVPPRTVVIGCEVETVEDGIGLSPVVNAAVPEAARAVTEVVAMLQSEVGTTAREG
ncbi:hydrogenase maturation protease [soil metagenome]